MKKALLITVLAVTMCLSVFALSACSEEKAYELVHSAHVESTCTTEGHEEYWSDGIKYYTDKDGKNEVSYDTLIIHKKPHTPASDWTTTDPDCHYHMCTDTSISSHDAGDKEAHDFEWIINNQVGVKHEECKVCHKKRSENTPIGGDTPSLRHVDKQDEDCGNDGWNEYYTDDNGHYYSDEAGEHKLDWKTDILRPATGRHQAEDAWQKEDGKHWHNCSVCGKPADEKVDHEFEWKTDIEPGETTPGKKHEECVCGAKRNENTEIPPTVDLLFNLVIDSSKAKTDYLYGEDFDPTGLVVTLEKEGTTPRDVDLNECTFKGFNSLCANQELPITVTYSKYSAVYYVTVTVTLDDLLSAYEKDTNLSKGFLQEGQNILGKYSLSGTQEIVFYGASNFAFWKTMENDLQPFKVQNHAFGGSTDKDLVAYAPYLLYPYDPSFVFFQTGSNDYAQSTQPTDAEKVREAMDYKKQMFAMFHEQMPDATFIVMAGILLPGRAQFLDMTKEINRQLREYCATQDYLRYVDSEEMTYNENTGFGEDLFVSDRIHLTPAARILWADRYILPELEEINAPRFDSSEIHAHSFDGNKTEYNTSIKKFYRVCDRGCGTTGEAVGHFANRYVVVDGVKYLVDDCYKEENLSKGITYDPITQEFIIRISDNYSDALTIATRDDNVILSVEKDIVLSSFKFSDEWGANHNLKIAGTHKLTVKSDISIATALTVESDLSVYGKLIVRKLTVGDADGKSNPVLNIKGTGVTNAIPNVGTAVINYRLLSGTVNIQNNDGFNFSGGMEIKGNHTGNTVYVGVNATLNIKNFNYGIRFAADDGKLEIVGTLNIISKANATDKVNVAVNGGTLTIYASGGNGISGGSAEFISGKATLLRNMFGSAAFDSITSLKVASGFDLGIKSFTRVVDGSEPETLEIADDTLTLENIGELDQDTHITDVKYKQAFVKPSTLDIPDIPDAE